MSPSTIAATQDALACLPRETTKRLLGEVAHALQVRAVLVNMRGEAVWRAAAFEDRCDRACCNHADEPAMPCAHGLSCLSTTINYRQEPVGSLCLCHDPQRAAELGPLAAMAAGRLADQVAAAYELRNLSSEIVSNYEHLAWLCRASSRLGATMSPERICERLAEEVMEQLRPQNVMVALLDPDTAEPRTCACCGEPTDAYTVPAGGLPNGILAHVLATGQPAIVCNVIHSAPPPFPGGMVGSVLCVPLVAHEKVLGAVCAREKLSGEEFYAVDMKLVAAIAAQSAMAISNSLLFGDIKELFLGTVRSLASAVDAKDPYTLGHSQRVTRSALAIAEEMDLPADDLEDVQLAGLLHDVGKIGLPDHILLKPGRLDESEWAEVKKHPARGEEILRPIKQMSRVATWIRHEHERWDGSGYPDGLRGQDIPLASRIIAVADAFDALTSDRSYRKAVSGEAAIRQLKAAAGTDYDPVVVRAFLRAHQRGRIIEGRAAG